MSRLKTRKIHRILCICLTVLSSSSGWTKIPVDYNSNPIPKDKGVVLIPQSIYYNSLLHAVSSPQLAGYLQQAFGGVPAAPTQAAPGTTYVFPTIGGGNSDVIRGLAIQSDQKIVAAGYTSLAGGGQRFAVARFLSNGQLDNVFGNSGTNYIPTSIIAGQVGNNSGKAIALQSDGKIIVVGGVTDITLFPTRFGVVRFLSNGQLDTSFGGTGRAIAGSAFVDASIAGHATVGADDTPTAVAIQPDGKIVVAGYVKSAGGGYRFGLARFLTNGTLDPEFGGFPAPAPAGTTYIDQSISGAGGGSDFSFAIALLPDGKIVLGGFTTSPVSTVPQGAIACFLSDGTLDPNFGNQAGGVAGTTLVPYILQLNPGDETNKITCLAVQSDNKIVGGCYVSDDGPDTQYFGAVRFTTTGLLDETFGGFPAPAPLGTTYVPLINGTHNECSAIVLQPDGAILLGGTVNFTDRFGLVRLLSNGQLDISFGGFPGAAPAGTTYLNAPILANGDAAYAIGLSSNGTIVLGGKSQSGGGIDYFSLAAFTNNYTLTTYQDEYPTQGGFY